jgi:exodeoxyribonuclease V alpha subunit
MQAELMLKQWQAQGWLRPLDQAFASFIARYVPAQPLVCIAAALCSYQLKQGHVCLDLATLLMEPLSTLGLSAELPEPEQQQTLQQQFATFTLAQWQQALSQSAVVDQGPGNNPLVLVGHRLYLRRYWQYEQDIASQINQRLQHSKLLAAGLPEAELLPLLQQLFQSNDQQPDWQQLA